VKAFAAMKKIFEILDTPSKIDPRLPHGIKEGAFTGDIQFKDVTFAYPTRPTEKVFEKLNFEIKHGCKVGLAGQSGCGKSSII